MKIRKNYFIKKNRKITVLRLKKQSYIMVIEKNDILKDINYFVKMSVHYSVSGQIIMCDLAQEP